MTFPVDASLMRNRLYQAYVSQHAGQGNGHAAALVYRRDLRPLLVPPSYGPVLDIGCGQGELLRLLLADGYDAEGVDVSPEQVEIAHSTGMNLVHEGDYRDFLNGRPAKYAAVTATDVLEHLSKEEVLDTFDHVAGALIPGGIFVARVPNAVSPFGGHIRYGDFTHETWFTQRSVRQLAAAAGFGSVVTLACPPLAHGPVSAGRLAVWWAVSAFSKAALAAETGVLHGHIVTQNLTFAARKNR